MASTMFLKPGLRPSAPKIYLRDVHDRETISLRTIQLTAPTVEIKIGRGSQTEPQLHPQSMNAWFTSRVMSREHAILQVDQSKREILLADAKSMHGTFLDGKRLEQGEKAVVTQGQRIQFGTEIVRGEQTYKPLELDLQVHWTDLPPGWPPLPNFPKLATRNTFSSDYSEEEDDDEGDDDVEVVYESIRIPDEVQAKKFSVPESDDSDSSIMHKDFEEESAPSSPMDPTKLQSDAAAPLPVIINATTMSTTKINNSTKTNEIADVPGSSMDSALDVSDDDDIEADLDQEEHLSDSSVNDDDYTSSCDAEDYDNEDAPYSEFDEDLDDEENDSVWESMPPNLSPTKVQAHKDNRAPSPSDAAMPKPSWYTSGIVDQNVAQVAYDDLRQGQLSNTQIQQQVMPPYQNYNCYYQPPWSASTMSSYAEPFARPAVTWQSAPVPHRPSNDFAFVRPAVYPLAPNPHSGANTSNIAFNTAKAVDDIVAAQNNDIHDALSKSSKVSINDIIENAISESSARKRKADDISTSTSEEVNNVQNLVSEADITISETPEEEPRAGVDSNMDMAEVTDTVTAIEKGAKSTPEKKKTVTFSPDAVIIEAEPELEPERSQKRVKVDHKEGSTFFKYAATAAAGMAVGAIGTVFGLVALPAEYFA